VLGFIVLGTALVRLGGNVGWGEAAVFVLMLVAGGLIIYSFWLILALSPSGCAGGEHPGHLPKHV